MIHIEEKKTNKLPGITSLFVTFDYRPDLVDIVKNQSNAIYDKETKVWEIPLTSLSSFLDAACVVDDINIKFLSEKSKKSKVYTLSNYKTKPFPYQAEGIQFGLNHDSWLLLDAPGLGKTLQLCLLAQELKEREGLEHCLIICGINTLKTNWKREIHKHTNLSCKILGERITRRGNSVIGSVKDRLAELQKPIEEFFVITNIETLREDSIVKAINKGTNKFDMIVVDEVHTCKSPTSQQGKHLLKLTKAKKRIAATGTMLMNNPLDAYVPLKWIGAEKSNYTNFRYFYCTYGGQFNNILLGFKNLKVLKDQIERYSLRRTKDLLDLPEKTVIDEIVDMSDSQQVFYDNIKQGIIDQVDKVHMSTACLLSMVSRLRQATACPSILTSESIQSSKIQRACDLAEQIMQSGSKVVIFSTFKETVYEISKQLAQYNPLISTGNEPDSVIDSNIQKFQNDDNYKLFIGTWQKCGTGITLNAASYMIFIDTPWTQAAYLQAQDRIHRIGTKQAVTIYNLIAKGTIDERVHELVQDKAALSDYIIDDKITQKSLESLRKYIEELQ